MVGGIDEILSKKDKRIIGTMLLFIFSLIFLLNYFGYFENSRRDEILDEVFKTNVIEKYTNKSEHMTPMLKLSNGNEMINYFPKHNVELKKHKINMIGIAILFTILGILIKYGKMYFLIAGYNTMSKEEKEKVDIKGIATVFRNAMFGMALIIITGYFFAKKLKNPNIENIAFFGAILIGVPYLLIKSNSKKYKL